MKIHISKADTEFLCLIAKLKIDKDNLISSRSILIFLNVNVPNAT